MAEIKMIATDLDETFLHTGIVSPENAKALRMAQAAGIVVCPCTGRAWTMCRYTLPDMGFRDYFVTANGAAVYHLDKEEALAKHYLAPTVFDALFAACKKEGIRHTVFCGDWVSAYEPLGAKWLEGMQKRNLTLPEERRTRVKIFTDEQAFCADVRENAQLFRVQVDTPETPLPAFLGALLDQMGQFEVSMSFASHWDIVDHTATKRNGLEDVARILGIGSENVMALGDSGNDITILRWAGLGIAMGNAKPDVKAEADYITDECTQDGWAKAVKRFALHMEE